MVAASAAGMEGPAMSFSKAAFCVASSSRFAAHTVSLDQIFRLSLSEAVFSYVASSSHFAPGTHNFGSDLGRKGPQCPCQKQPRCPFQEQCLSALPAQAILLHKQCCLQAWQKGLRCPFHKQSFSALPPLAATTNIFGSGLGSSSLRPCE